jgi:hypothetical protein
MLQTRVTACVDAQIIVGVLVQCATLTHLNHVISNNVSGRRIPGLKIYAPPVELGGSVQGIYLSK